MKPTAILLTLLLTASCAHEFHGTPADVTSSVAEALPVEFKSYEDGQLSTDRFVVIQMSFKNNKDEWMRIKEVEIVPENEEQARTLHVLLGQDLKAWSKGTQERIAIEKQNFDAITGAVIIASMVGAYATARNGDFNAAGNLIYVGGAASAIGSGKKLYDQIRELNRGGMMPDGHILAPFSVPPGMVSRHWVVLEKPEKTPLKSLNLKLTSLEGLSTSYKLEL